MDPSILAQYSLFCQSNFKATEGLLKPEGRFSFVGSKLITPFFSSIPKEKRYVDAASLAARKLPSSLMVAQFKLKELWIDIVFT
mmetsp:Transcript_15349/g.31351  ORF Transcript_15349/g.31351 Transcript_15349/m.31351 type:complete len:84 (+) Transcript_15349:603-854(+)